MATDKVAEVLETVKNFSPEERKRLIKELEASGKGPELDSKEKVINFLKMILRHTQSGELKWGEEPKYGIFGTVVDSIKASLYRGDGFSGPSYVQFTLPTGEATHYNVNSFPFLFCELDRLFWKISKAEQKNRMGSKRS